MTAEDRLPLSAVVRAYEDQLGPLRMHQRALLVELPAWLTEQWWEKFIDPAPLRPPLPHVELWLRRRAEEIANEEAELLNAMRSTGVAKAVEEFLTARGATFVGGERLVTMRKAHESSARPWDAAFEGNDRLARIEHLFELMVWADEAAADGYIDTRHPDTPS